MLSPFVLASFTNSFLLFFVTCFSVQSCNLPESDGPVIAFWTFIHRTLFLYPASNGYNSYFDKDEKSIGGLKNPPPVNQGSVLSSPSCLMLSPLCLGLIMINVTFALMLFIYGVVSKAYSHPAIRLKKFPVTGWLVAGFFQGLFTLLMCYIGINDYSLENRLNNSPGTWCSVHYYAMG